MSVCNFEVAIKFRTWYIINNLVLGTDMEDARG